MVSLTYLLAAGSAALVAATPFPFGSPGRPGPPGQNETFGCGEVNVFYTGLPPWHKYVVEQGYPPEEAEGAIKNSTKLMVERGYNVKMFLIGPEKDMSITADAMAGKYWHTTGVGFGMRGATNEEVIRKFEDNLMLFRRQGPMSPTVFNYNPWTFLWSVERYFPLPDCTDSPGTDYGYEEVCDEMCEGQPDA